MLIRRVMRPGLVRAPLMTTVMQVASRFLLVWGVVHVFPDATSTSPAYSSMLLAWSVTEVIRYSYFAVNLSFGKVPGWMTWLRYNTFFVLYPLGISSECWLVWKATEPAESVNPLLKWALIGILVIYIPGESCQKVQLMTNADQSQDRIFYSRT